LREIASKEGVKIIDEGLEAIWDISQGDMRKAINTLQAAAATAKEITPEIIYKTVGFIEPKEIIELVNIALSGDFIKARDKLRALMYEHGVSGTDILRAVQRQIMSSNISMPDEAKVEIAEIAADIDYRLTEGSDEEIQLSVFIAKLMLIGKKYGLETGKEVSKESKTPTRRR
ncbi:MAG: Replication factor C small subunit, partial [Vulcanisaeta sp. AZ3]|jgi:replication factor C small subunit